jgi:hypothetical protein
MNIKITPDHLNRAAVVYVRQSTMTQVMGNLESPSGAEQRHGENAAGLRLPPASTDHTAVISNPLFLQFSIELHQALRQHLDPRHP